MDGKRPPAAAEVPVRTDLVDVTAQVIEVTPPALRLIRADGPPDPPQPVATRLAVPEVSEPERPLLPVRHLRGPTIRRALLIAMAKRGVSQSKVAKAAGFPRQSLNVYLCGQRSLPTDRLESVLEVLGLREAVFSAIADTEPERSTA